MNKLTKLRHEAASSPSGIIKVSIEALNEVEAENARLKKRIQGLIDEWDRNPITNRISETNLGWFIRRVGEEAGLWHKVLETWETPRESRG